jgi:hypothetical protein
MYHLTEKPRRTASPKSRPRAFVLLAEFTPRPAAAGAPFPAKNKNQLCLY